MGVCDMCCAGLRRICDVAMCAVLAALLRWLWWYAAVCLVCCRKPVQSSQSQPPPRVLLRTAHTPHTVTSTDRQHSHREPHRGHTAPRKKTHSKSTAAWRHARRMEGLPLRSTRRRGSGSARFVLVKWNAYSRPAARDSCFDMMCRDGALGLKLDMTSLLAARCRCGAACRL